MYNLIVNMFVAVWILWIAPEPNRKTDFYIRYLLVLLFSFNMVQVCYELAK